jgi:hypothetical protein
LSFRRKVAPFCHTFLEVNVASVICYNNARIFINQARNKTYELGRVRN